MNKMSRSVDPGTTRRESTLLRNRFASSPSMTVLIAALTVAVWSISTPVSGAPVQGETNHKAYFKGTDSELDVYFIRGRTAGPTLFLLGGIQGDEPGGYLAADLYADLTLKKGNMIVVPRANFLSIVQDRRGVEGDMNRKFAGPPKAADRDLAIVGIIKDLMRQSDFFLNLHDGSGFYSPTWESPTRNPMLFGQSVIIDADKYTLPDGTAIDMEKLVSRVLDKVNSQISDPDHLFRLNNHRTVRSDTRHKEQRLSATFHALTKVGIPAFGIETSRNIADFRLRVRYQTMAINAFLDEFGIVPDNPRMYLENPFLKYLIVSINGRTPIVVSGQDVLKVHRGDKLRIVHIESNYSRGLTAMIKGAGGGLNDLDKEVVATQNAMIQVNKDRFVIAELPVEIISRQSPVSTGVHFEPRIKYFCVRVNDRTLLLEPGETLRAVKGDSLVIMDPSTNLDSDDEREVRIDLRGFQASSSPYPVEDRGHHINTATDLQEKYGRVQGDATLYPLQAKLKNNVFGESFIAVTEPKLEYFVLQESGGGTFVAYRGDQLQLPAHALIKIMDIRTNADDSTPLVLSMAGSAIRWRQHGSAGIDASKLADRDPTPLEVTRNGYKLGQILLRRGDNLGLTSSQNQPRSLLLPVRY
ncbi:MAG: succinylglutamate desuccinylase/aspartoacylase family protein [Deltaproteobacteria bacterium]|nr:succinylglutamate desuccinylase/aspartoacylase family protein [Deltaproteobacteria bacterium]